MIKACDAKVEQMACGAKVEEMVALPSMTRLSYA
jgi:hypothetical protein